MLLKPDLRDWEVEIIIMSEKRNVKYDICKGIACWLVIWGHTIQYCYAGDSAFYENFVFRFIYGFHMPFFMMISGYLYCVSCQKYELSLVIKKQSLRIAYPLFIGNEIHFLHKLIFEVRYINTFSDLLRLIYKTFTGLWFLWSVLIISILVALIYYSTATSIKRSAGYIIVFMVLIIVPAKIEPCKTMNVWMYPYFLTGFLLSEKRDAIHQLKRGKRDGIKYVLLPLYPLLIPYFHYKDYIYTSGINLLGSDYGFKVQLLIDVYRWVLGYAGIFFMIVILQFLFRILYVKHMLSRMFGNLGQATLQIYIIQRVLIEEIFGELCKMILPYGGGVITKNPYLYNFVLTPVVGFVHLLIICKIIKRIKKYDKLNRYLFGEVFEYDKTLE